jgi:hypothetical protein
VFCTPPPPPLWVVWMTMTWTGWPAACSPPVTGSLWRRRCAGRRRHCRRRGETGGGREARGIPGRGEEDGYRGRKLQGGMDEAQRGWEEEEGGSDGGWARDGVLGAGGELGHSGRRRWPRTGRQRGGCPLVTFWRGGLSSRPLSIVAYP